MTRKGTVHSRARNPCESFRVRETFEKTAKGWGWAEFRLRQEPTAFGADGQPSPHGGALLHETEFVQVGQFSDGEAQRTVRYGYQTPLTPFCPYPPSKRPRNHPLPSSSA